MVQLQYIEYFISQHKQTRCRVTKSPEYESLYALINPHFLVTGKRNLTRKHAALDPGQNDCISLTHDPDLWPWPSIPCKLWSPPTHMQKAKVKGQLVQNIEWTQTDRQMDRGDRITEIANAIANHM